MTQTQQPPTSAVGPEVAKAVGWLRSNAVAMAALALIAAATWWRSVLLAHSFFRLDDYLIQERASSQGLGWNYLMWMNAGHLTPVGNAIAWLVVRISPVDWTLASAVTILLLVLACLALLRMLRTLFGDHPGILLLLAIYVVSPLALSGLSWWTATLEQLPLQISMFCAVTAHVHYLRSGELRHALAASGWLAAGLASSFKGAGIPLALFALTSAFFVAGPWSHRALGSTLLRWWRAWLIYAALTLAYVVVYIDRLATSTVSPSRPGAFSGVFSFAGTLLGDTFVPGVLGGPWHWLGAGVYASVSPPAGLARLSWLVAAAVVAVSILHSARAWRAWVILAAWLVVIDMTPVVLGRESFLPGALLGLVTRYVWDALAITVLCAGLAFLPVEGLSDQGRRLGIGRRTHTAAVGVCTAVFIGAIWSYYAYPTDSGAAAGRSYVATARIALSQAPPGTVIVDDPVPQDVMGGAFIGYGVFTASAGEASSLLAPLIDGRPGIAPRFVTLPDGTYDHLMEFDGWGRLVPSVISGAGSVPLATGAACWPAHHGTVVIPLDLVATHPTTLRIGYLAASSGQVWVKFGGHWQLYNFQRGLHSAYLPVRSSGRSVVVEALTGSPPCIGDAQVGVLLPSGSGSAIPPFAVSG